MADSSLCIMPQLLIERQECKYNVTLKQSTVYDYRDHCLYISDSLVSLLPIRRTTNKLGQLQESIIHLTELQPRPHSALLRIKHVALNFTRDFSASPGCVPGLNMIGRVVLNNETTDPKLCGADARRVFVFPYTNCIIQDSTPLCANCSKVTTLSNHIDNDEYAQYDVHRKYPCLRNLVYGKTIDGGLQDFLRVPHPLKQLIAVPKQVSLHDCCFLMDVALPFMVYCKEILSKSTRKNSKVLVFLNDCEMEVNDCLLVIRHLDLHDHLFTFTDLKTLNSNSSLKDSYKNEFNNVLLIAAGQHAFGLSLAFKEPNLTLTLDVSPIAIFESPGEQHISIPLGLNVQRIVMSYKDKFHMERLLETLSGMSGSATTGSVSSGNSSIETSHKQDISIQFFSSNGTKVPSTFPVSRETAETSPRSSSETADETGSKKSRESKRLVRWLQCDHDFLLGSEDLTDFETVGDRLLTSTINRLIMNDFRPRRVFFTNSKAKNATLNAFVFT